MSRPRWPPRGWRSSGCRRRSTTTSSATDYTFGFDTAVQIAVDAIDRLHTTAESHHRVLDRRGDGPPRRLDRAALGARRRRERDPDPGAAVRHRRRSAPTSSTGSPRTTRRSSSSPRARRPTAGTIAPHRPGRGRVRPRPARRHRAAAGAGDRGADRQGGPRDGARPRAAGRYADGVRPGVGDPVRTARDRRGPRRRVGGDGGAARHGHRAGAARRGDQGAQDGLRRSGTPRSRSSSADEGTS